MKMYTAQKKISALGFVLLLAIPLVFSVIVVIQQKVLQINSHAKFGTAAIETITVSKNNIKWVKKGKEIVINGNYFDVKSFTISGNNVLLTGYYDHKEDKLVSRIKKLFDKKNKSESTADLIVIKYLFFPTYTPEADITIAINWVANSTNFSSYAEKLCSVSSPIFTPPPQS